MFIEKIEIKNFRVYKGMNELALSTKARQNVSIISGNNGFGKTSFLTSLVWCLYGKLMGDVDERYRQEIYDSGGYKRYCEKLMNKSALTESKKEINQYELSLEGAKTDKKTTIVEKLEHRATFSVSIRFSKLLIPSVPCEHVQIKRTYNVQTEKETVEILIDGRPNELTEKVGPDIFINDFILPKEIAKFFFFDAEKIVSLAEIRTIEERKTLSQAYAEVLGIKKYLDLKEHLAKIQLRLKKKSSNVADRERLVKLEQQMEQNEKLVAHNENMIKEKEEELNVKRNTSDKLHEDLVRAGTSMSVDELKNFRKIRDDYHEEGNKIKERLKDLVELAPLAIAGNKFSAVKQQLESEQEQNDQGDTDDLLQRKYSAIKRAFAKHGNELSLNKTKEDKVLQIIRETLIPEQKKRVKPLLDFTPEKFKLFISVYDKLQDSYSTNFRQLNADLKKQQSALNDISRRLQSAESQEKDPVVKAIREDKIQLDAEIKALEKEIIDLNVKTGILKNDIKSLDQQISTLSKKVIVEDIHQEKDETATRLINELDDFILKLKTRKKDALEKNILQQLNRLMHKSTFVTRVEVRIEGDLIDIDLYDRNGQLINKDGLSKGEQQLYATALLQGLVLESNIQFPVFIDSPLQKFDKEHSKNIIKDFYPNASNQVVLFPLLEKELNEEEYKWLLPRVGSTYLIEHMGQYQSQFRKTEPEHLFETYRENKNYVYQH
jgi:DNA sulfur modification protein DndD